MTKKFRPPDPPWRRYDFLKFCDPQKSENLILILLTIQLPIKTSRHNKKGVFLKDIEDHEKKNFENILKIFEDR